MSTGFILQLWTKVSAWISEKMNQFFFLFFCRSKATQQFASRSAKAKLGCTCAVADGTCPVRRMNALSCHGSSGSTRPWLLTVRSMETSCSSMLAKVSEIIRNKADCQTFQTKQKQKFFVLFFTYLTPSLPWCHWKQPIKLWNLKSLSLSQVSVFFFALAWERIFIKMHSMKSRCVIEQKNTLFAGASMHLSARKYCRPGQWRG